jgi:hypothetical protein
MAIFGKKSNTKEVEETEEGEGAPVEADAPTETRASKPAGKKEHLFGTLLIGLLIVVVCFGLFGVGFGAFTLWKMQSSQNESPSISGLMTTPAENEAETATQEVKEMIAPESQAQEKVESSEEGLKAAQGLDVIVMNGGGAKGVATEVASVLKKEGFTKVSVGNTTGDFTGTVLYFKKEMSKEAEALKAKLVSSYPKLVTKEALASDKETQTASLTLIFGKE